MRTRRGRHRTHSSSSDRISRNIYDQDGRLFYTVDGDGYVTAYSYDAAGRLTQMTDPYGVNTVLGRNVSGLIAAAADGNGNQNTFQYDSDGVLTKWTDALGGA